MAWPEAGVVLICGRIDDPQCSHGPNSIQFKCHDCGYAVMASPATTAAHRANGTPIVCVQCFARYRDQGNPVILVREYP